MKPSILIKILLTVISLKAKRKTRRFNEELIPRFCLYKSVQEVNQVIKNMTPIKEI